MKLPLLAAFLALAASAVAGPAGSYAPVTSGLTILSDAQATPLVLKNGNKQTTATTITYKLTNAAILAECQRQGYLTAGSIIGWKIYAVYDANALVGFYINNGLQTVAIPTVMGVSRNLNGFATHGKWVHDTQGALISGGTTYRDGFLLTVSINNISYTSTVILTIGDKLIPMWPLSEPVWRPGGWKVAVNGLSDDASENMMQGTLSAAAAKATYNLNLGLMGFPGFAVETEE